MRPFAVSLAAFALIAATAASAPAQPAPTLDRQARAGLFDYAPGSTTCAPPADPGQGGTTVQIGGPGVTPLNALVIAPAGSLKKAPAVLWVHWLGETATTNHTEFQSDALALVKNGVVSMLVDMPWSQKDWFNGVRTTDADYANTIAQVIALRRALDCLVKYPGVDKTRIAYVGHDFGAMVGALLLAVDGRPSYAVLMAPTLSFWEWYLLGKQPADPAAYVAQMSVFDLPGWLANGKKKRDAAASRPARRVRVASDRHRNSKRDSQPRPHPARLQARPRPRRRNHARRPPHLARQPARSDAMTTRRETSLSGDAVRRRCHPELVEGRLRLKPARPRARRRRRR
jgi:predicted esterase